jgi:hypothetical protein
LNASLETPLVLSVVIMHIAKDVLFCNRQHPWHENLLPPSSLIDLVQTLKKKLYSIILLQIPMKSNKT